MGRCEWGKGPGVFIVILGNLIEGTPIYPDLVNDNKGPEAAQYVTETILLKYGNELIEVNHMNLTYTVDAQPHSEKNYWEKSTGLIIEWIISSSEVEDNLIETTNIIFQRVGLQQVFYP